MINKCDGCDGFSSRGLGCGCEAGTIDISEDSGIFWALIGTVLHICPKHVQLLLPVQEIKRNKESR